MIENSSYITIAMMPTTSRPLNARPICIELPAEMTAGDSGIGYLMQTAGSQQRMPLAFAGLVTIGAMAMAMYELFSWVEKRTTGWAHRGSQAA